jgi:hypothetical protein
MPGGVMSKDGSKKVDSAAKDFKQEAIKQEVTPKASAQAPNQEVLATEEQTLRNHAVASIREKIKALEKIEKELDHEKSDLTRFKKRALSAIGQSQVSKLELVRQLKKELQNLVAASENTQNPLSGAALSGRMTQSLHRFFKQDSKRTERNPPESYRQFLRESDLLLECQYMHFLLRKYANDHYSFAQKNFNAVILKHANLPKNVGKKTIATNPQTKTGDFLATFYPSPYEPRDQVVIDAFKEYSNSERNQKTELYALGAIMADLSSFQVTLARIARAKIDLKGDPESLKMALDSFLEADLMRKYDAIMDPKKGIVKQIKDPKLRKMLLDSMRDIKSKIEADLPKGYKLKPQK